MPVATAFAAGLALQMPPFWIARPFTLMVLAELGDVPSPGDSRPGLLERPSRNLRTEAIERSAL